jgi:hypothetical protein
MKRKPKPTTDKAMVLRDLLKASASKLETRQFQDAAFKCVRCASVVLFSSVGSRYLCVSAQVYESTLRYFSLFASSIAFPEVAVTAVAKISVFAKASKNPAFQKQAKQLAEKVRVTFLLLYFLCMAGC